jgi:hypothetical protein
VFLKPKGRGGGGGVKELGPFFLSILSGATGKGPKTNLTKHVR